MRIRAAFFAELVLAASVAAASEANSQADGELEALQELILPGAEDSQWRGVSWRPASDTWAARQQTAAKGRPLFLWHLAGEPLGPC